jgi:hypothetical protein
MLQKLLVLAAVALSYVQAAPSISIGDSNCDVYCNLEMPGVESVVLRVGERITPLAIDPCTAYVCGNDGQMRVEVETCATVEVCADGKPPYWVPGTCCKGCMYSTVASFGLQPETVEVIEANDTDKPIANPPNTWSAWTSWTECGVSCGGGRQSRTRECKTQGARVLDCTGLAVEIRDCNTHHCPSKW